MDLVAKKEVVIISGQTQMWEKAFLATSAMCSPKSSCRSSDAPRLQILIINGEQAPSTKGLDKM